jgi:hypothetical protein
MFRWDRLSARQFKQVYYGAADDHVCCVIADIVANAREPDPKI